MPLPINQAQRVQTLVDSWIQILHGHHLAAEPWLLHLEGNGKDGI